MKLSTRMIVVLVAVVAHRTAAAAPDDTSASPEQRLGACTAEMPHPAFDATAELKVLITRFAGADGSEQSVQFGAALGLAVQRVLPVYVKKIVDASVRKTGLRPDLLQAEFVPCLVTGHDMARTIGQAWGTDLVVWGTAQTTQAQDTDALIRLFRREVKDLRVASDNVVDAPDAASVSIKGVVNIKVRAPAAAATFQTSMTVVSWRGLETEGAGRRVTTVLDQDFPRLATDQPLALFYLVLGNHAYRGKRYAVAARFFEHSTEGVFASADHQDFLYWIIADSYAQAGAPQRSLALVQKSLDTCQPDDARCRALYLNNLAWVLERCGRKQEALERYSQALALSEQIHYPYIEAAAINNIASLTVPTDPRRAIELLKRALVLRREISDVVGEASTLHNLGGAYWQLGEYPEAERYFTESLPVRRRANDVAGEATTWSQLGDIYARQARFPEAFEALDHERAANRLLGDPLREQQIELSAWAVAKQAKDEARAAQAGAAVVSWLASHDALVGKIPEPSMLNNIGKMFYDMGQHRRAIGFYHRALAIFKARADRAGEGLSYNNIGKALYALRDYKQALGYYQRGLPLLNTDAGLLYRDYLLHNLGLLHAALHHPERAVPFYEEALQLRQHKSAKPETADTLIALATAYAELARTEEAVARAREAAAILRGGASPDQAQASRCLDSALRWAERANRPDLADQVRDDQVPADPASP